MLRLDHVVFAVRDLDDAAARLLDRYGLASVQGGSHDGVGTANRIVPLGPAYIELMGVADEKTAQSNPMGHYLLNFLEGGDRLLTWCVATDDIARQARWIGSAAASWSRTRPDGTVLSWRLAGIEGALADRSLPFFIQWDIPDELHPGRDAAVHPCAPAEFARLEVGGDAKKVERRVGGADLPVIVTPGEPGPRSVTIAARDGDITIP